MLQASHCQYPSSYEQLHTNSGARFESPDTSTISLNTVQHPSMSKVSTRYSFKVQFGTIYYSTQSVANFQRVHCEELGKFVRLNGRLDECLSYHESPPSAVHRVRSLRSPCSPQYLHAAETNGHL